MLYGSIYVLIGTVTVYKLILHLFSDSRCVAIPRCSSEWLPSDSPFHFRQESLSVAFCCNHSVLTFSWRDDSSGIVSCTPREAMPPTQLCFKHPALARQREHPSAADATIAGFARCSCEPVPTCMHMKRVSICVSCRGSNYKSIWPVSSKMREVCVC